MHRPPDAEDEILRLQEEVDEARSAGASRSVHSRRRKPIGRALLVAERHADQVRRQVEAETKQITDTARAEVEDLRASARADADATLERALEEAERLEAEAAARREEAAREMEAQAATAAAACDSSWPRRRARRKRCGPARAPRRTPACRTRGTGSTRCDRPRKQRCSAGLPIPHRRGLAHRRSGLELLKDRRQNFERKWNNRVRGLVAFLEAERAPAARPGRRGQ